MSEEEKQAIEWLENSDFKSLREKDIFAVETILNLIDKQQKEIEQLDKKFQYSVPDGFTNDDYISKDKIREKLKRKREDINYTYYDFYLDFKELLEE